MVGLPGFGPAFESLDGVDFMDEDVAVRAERVDRNGRRTVARNDDRPAGPFDPEPEGPFPVSVMHPEGFHTHAIDGGEISCFRNGIAEPVTWAITELLVQDIPGVDREAWVREAAATGSLPLINRMGQALSHISKVAGRSEWAEQMLEQVFRPALRDHPQFH